MRSRFPKLPDSLFRLGVVFAGLIGVVLLIRAVLPAELIDTALHEKATIERELSKPINYAGSDACAACHEESVVKSAGYHSSLSCETCHGAAKNHSEDPTEFKPLAPRKREFCTLCHTYNQSRPTGFPQINPVAHNPLKPCTSCHNPHDPKPPTVPRECEACHGEIARTKSVSPHVNLECSVCHSAPNDHKVRPRSVRVPIPTSRQFCARCHGLDAKVKDVPKVDFSSHGEKYLCWQCHYPHMPEI